VHDGDPAQRKHRAGSQVVYRPLKPRPQFGSGQIAAAAIATAKVASAGFTLRSDYAGGARLPHRNIEEVGRLTSCHTWLPVNFTPENARSLALLALRLLRKDWQVQVALALPSKLLHAIAANSC
jgi:hypothetical protein